MADYYLVHHGIIGQRWGVRRYQNKDGSLTAEGTKRYGLVSITKAAIKDASIKREYRMLKDLSENSPYKSFADVPKIAGNSTIEENAAVVNKYNRRENCAECTVAMILREKGYDVVAGNNTNDKQHFSGLYYRNQINMFDFKKQSSVFPTIISAKNFDDCVKKMQNKTKDGDYGDFSMAMFDGGGHSVFWKNEKGTIRMYDAQTNVDCISNKDYVKTVNEWANPRMFAFVNYRNAEPNNLALSIIEGRNN